MQKEGKYISEILNLKGRGFELSKKDYDDLVRHLCNKTISAVQLGKLSSRKPINKNHFIYAFEAKF